MLLGAALLCVFGARAAVTLPIDAVPDVTNVQVQVITISPPSRGWMEVEQYGEHSLLERAYRRGFPWMTEMAIISSNTASPWSPHRVRGRHGHVLGVSARLVQQYGTESSKCGTGHRTMHCSRAQRPRGSTGHVRKGDAV